MAIHKDIHCFLLWFMSRLAPFRTSFLAISATHEGLAVSADIDIFPRCSFSWAVSPAPQPVIPQEPLMMPFLHHLPHGPSRNRCFCQSFQTNVETDTEIKAGDVVLGCVRAFLSCPVLQAKIPNLIQSSALSPCNENDRNNIFAKCLYMWKIWCKLKAT